MSQRTPTKILLVDDLEENLLALQALLRSDELIILSAHGAVEALELLLLHDVALALIDVQMPELDGFELGELMRGNERTKRIPIIFVTAGNHDRSRMFQGYDAGAVDFLFKPIEERILRHKVNTFVELHVQRQLLSDRLADLERSEAEACRLRDELEQHLRLNETFLGVVGHDLRSPLNVISIATAMLKEELHDPEQRPILDRINNATQQMSRLIGDLYDLTRARVGGGISINPQPNVDLAQLVDRTTSALSTTYPGRELHIEKSGDLVGVWDSDRLIQILSNVMSNALRHGTPDVPVRVTGDGTEPHWVLITVQNGGTVPPHLLPHVFEPFRRDKASRREGLGLGLYIVQQLVQAHSGYITISSQNDRTQVRIRLARNLNAGKPSA